MAISEQEFNNKWKDDEDKVDKTLLNLNTAIETNIKQYFSQQDGIKIRFDIPDKADPPDEPTICVFLYDIQEDLELRHGQTRLYDAAKNTFARAQVHVRCCYLITYWEKENVSKKETGPRSQSMMVMNLVLNALLNLKLDLKEPLVPTFMRVIAPSEHLSSLGNFWQALDNKPRLCLNFAVTVPITLHAVSTDVVPPVMLPTEEFVLLVEPGDTHTPAESVAQALRTCLGNTLKRTNESHSQEPALFQAQLDTLKIACSLAGDGKLPTGSSATGGPWDVQVSGILHQDLIQRAKAEIDGWHTNSPLRDVKIGTINKDGLVAFVVPSRK